MDEEPIKAVRHKFVELKKCRETLRRHTIAEERSISQLEEQIHMLESLIKEKAQDILENEGKLAKYHTKLEQAQNALKQLSDTSRKLEDVIDMELKSIE